METWFCTTAGTEFCASTGLATWGCGSREAGVEDKTCVAAWAATCGRADCAETDNGAVAETWACTETEAGVGAKRGICVGAGAAMCVGAGTGAAIWVWADAEGVVWTWVGL